MKVKTLLHLSTCLATVITGAANAQVNPTWRIDASKVPFQVLDIHLDGAESVLYLNNRCEVVAWIIPSDADAASLIPSARKISGQWHHRTTEYSPTAENVPSCPDPLVFLDTTLESGANPDACKPNVLLGSDQLSDARCKIDSAAVDTAIVLDKFVQPIVIVNGELAKKVTPPSIPAVQLGRTDFTPGNPCSPALPPPCNPPRVGKEKKIGNATYCVCSLP